MKLIPLQLMFILILLLSGVLAGCARVTVEKDGDYVKVTTNTWAKNVQGFTLDKDADGSVRLKLESSNPTADPTGDMVCAMKLSKGLDCE